MREREKVAVETRWRVLKGWRLGTVYEYELLHETQNILFFPVQFFQYVSSVRLPLEVGL